MNRANKRYDIFCKIVDNFGDIGVCWRLVKQLQREHHLNIRLFVDDLTAAQKIIPKINVKSNQQNIDGMNVFIWHTETDFSDVADVVIEAFSCELPTDYLNAMLRKKFESGELTTWVNVEYLSAESWVADFHAKPSPQANGLIRHFYFPGFSKATGGLIRENNIAAQLQNLTAMKESKSNLKVSLFCYPHAPIESLLTVMAESNQPVDCYVPASSILPKIGHFIGLSILEAGKKYAYKNLHLHVLPFLSQADYDQLLAACDLNFVRGEDSWVRAIWAGKPFIWQPYFQVENTHIDKLTAFLDVFYANSNHKKVVSALHSAWVSGQISPTMWQDYLSQLTSISTDTLQLSQKLAQQTDLAAKLVIFCNKN